MSGLISIYTDGSITKNPGGVGGYAAVFYDGDVLIHEVSGGLKNTTNNRMEMLAVIYGLNSAIKLGLKEVAVFSDSQYVVKGMTEYIKKWHRNGWRTCGGKPVANKDLWELMVALNWHITVNWQWVKSHDGNYKNERADWLAKESSHVPVGYDKGYKEVE